MYTARVENNIVIFNASLSIMIKRFSVLTYNVHSHRQYYKEQEPCIIQNLTTYGFPDIICIQEGNKSLINKFIKEAKHNGCKYYYKTIWEY